MSEFERPDRLEREPTVEDVRQLMGASSPHFALQIRNRIRDLIDGLHEDHPARRLGETEMARLERLAVDGEHRGAAVPASPSCRAFAAPDVSGLDRAQALLADDLRRGGDVPLNGGYIDLLPLEGLPSTGLTQNLMLTRAVPEIYERWWRPALGRVAKGVFGPGMAEEMRIARLLLGLVPGDGVLDIACGTGNFTRHFARAVGPTGLVAGLDASTTMLNRAVEDTGGMEQVAYIRGDAQSLPSGTRASTRSAASRRCTCSPIR